MIKIDFVITSELWSDLGSDLGSDLDPNRVPFGRCYMVNKHHLGTIRSQNRVRFRVRFGPGSGSDSGSRNRDL
jgi:hypothetical protein